MIQLIPVVKSETKSETAAAATAVPMDTSASTASAPAAAATSVVSAPAVRSAERYAIAFDTYRDSPVSAGEKERDAKDERFAVAAFSPRGDAIYAGTNRGQITVFDITHAFPTPITDGSAVGAAAATASTHTPPPLTGRTDRVLRVRERIPSTLLSRSAIKHIVFSRSGGFVLINSADRVLRVLSSKYELAGCSGFGWLSL